MEKALNKELAAVNSIFKNVAISRTTQTWIMDVEFVPGEDFFLVLIIRNDKI